MTRAVEQKEKRFVTLDQFCAEGTWPTLGALRKLVFNAEKSGLDKHLRRVGGRVLLDANGFWEWVDGQGSRS